MVLIAYHKNINVEECNEHIPLLILTRIWYAVLLMKNISAWINELQMYDLPLKILIPHNQLSEI